MSTAGFVQDGFLAALLEAGAKVPLAYLEQFQPYMNIEETWANSPHVVERFLIPLVQSQRVELIMWLTQLLRERYDLTVRIPHFKQFADVLSDSGNLKDSPETLNSALSELAAITRRTN